ncbi:MAG TPA: hypothetical protein VF934_05615 [Burkholderiales bacterium]
MARSKSKALFVAFLIILVLDGCSHKLQRPDHGPLMKIAMMPVGNPREFEVANDNFFARFWGPASLVMFTENKRKSTVFAEKMRSEQMAMGEKLTKALLEELSRQGYEVELIERAQAKADDPDDIDYTRIHADGAVLHVWIQDIGMDSSVWRTDYLPRLTVAVNLIYPMDEEFLYEEWLYYGSEAKEGKNWSVPGKPRYRFASFEEMLNNPDQIVENFDDGIRATAQHVGREFRRAVK